jgi:hypothetical protein
LFSNGPLFPKPASRNRQHGGAVTACDAAVGTNASGRKFVVAIWREGLTL